MKLIIDIPEWKYKSICEGVEASKRCGVVGIDPDIHEAIYNGIPYEERPRGEWITEYDYLKCPFCGMTIDDEVHYLYPKEYGFNYCPNCGAKLEGGEV